VMAAAEMLGVPVVVVRGVSDLANPLKADDEWRRRGLRTALMTIERTMQIMNR